MAVVHIPEEEAVTNFRSILSRVDAGDNVIIDRNHSSLELRDLPARGKTVGEALAILKALNHQPSGDDSFADDIEDASRRMRSPSLHPSPWD